MLGAVDPASVNPWAFQAHPEVWLLVGSLIVLYVYAVRVIGPTVVPAGQPVVTRRQIGYFVAAITVLELGSDWPLHDVAEKYLYSAHMLQHMMLSYFMPPLVLLAMPEWFLRLVFDNSRAYAVLKFLTKPVIAGTNLNEGALFITLPLPLQPGGPGKQGGYWFYLTRLFGEDTAAEIIKLPRYAPSEDVIADTLRRVHDDEGDAPPERRYNLQETVTRMDLSGTSTLRTSWTGTGLQVESRYTNRARSTQRYTLDRTGAVLTVSLELNEPVSGKLQVRSVYRRATANAPGSAPAVVPTSTTAVPR